MRRTLAVLGALCLVTAAVIAQDANPPRRHLWPAPTPTPAPCQQGEPGTGPWFAAWEIEETAAVHMALDVVCGSAPCQVVMYLKSGGHDPAQPFLYESPGFGLMHFEGVYPPFVRAYLQPGISSLSARIEVHGAGSWAAQRVTLGLPVPWPANECRSPAW